MAEIAEGSADEKYFLSHSAVFECIKLDGFIIVWLHKS